MKSIKSKIFQSRDSWAPLLLRVLLGTVVLAHGSQKLFGWFGGYGFTGTMRFLTEAMNLPWLIAFIVIMLESVGAIALIAGIATRPVALCYTLLAFGIIVTSHLQNGFFMNWFGAQAGEGFEYFLLWIGMSLSLMISGGGKYSVDQELIAKTNVSA